MSNLSVNCKFNIVAIGGVSSGKTTLTNGIFGMTVSKTAMMRTTMTPQIYELVSSGGDSLDVVKARNDEANEKYKSTPWLVSDGAVHHRIQASPDITANLVSFKAGNAQIDYSICFHDLPGLNDARTKQEYFKYVDQNFASFDMIIFVIDVNSSLNTSDEMDMLQLIMSNMAKHPCRLTILVNKCDDLVEIPDNKLPGGMMQKVNCDVQEMMEKQITPSIGELIEKHQLDKFRVNIQYYSSMGVYVARMLRYESQYIDPALQNKFFVELHGARTWNKMTDQQQQEHIKSFKQEVVAKYDEFLRDYGFTRLFNSINITMNCEEVVQNRYVREVVSKCMTHMRGVVDALQSTGIVPDKKTINADISAYVEILRKFVRPNGNSANCITEIHRHITDTDTYVVKSDALPATLEMSVYRLYNQMLEKSPSTGIFNSIVIFCTELLVSLGLKVPPNIAFRGATAEKLASLAVWCQRFSHTYPADAIDAAIIYGIKLVSTEFVGKNEEFCMLNVITLGKIIDRFALSTDGPKSSAVKQMHELLTQIIDGCMIDIRAGARQSIREAEESIPLFLGNVEHVGDVSNCCAERRPWVILTWMLMAIEYTGQNGTAIIKRGRDKMYRVKMMLNVAVNASLIFEPNKGYEDLMKYY